MIETSESQAQLLARQLKEDAWSEVAHLPQEEASRERVRLAAGAVERLGLGIPVCDPRGSTLAVREDGIGYGRKH